MLYSTTVGIDTHSRKNAVCLLDVATGEVREATLPADAGELAAWIRKQGPAEPVGCVYESGPTGFGLARGLAGAGLACTVAATSKLPERKDRQKNDRADAEWLARLLAAGAVRPVRVPTPAEEALAHLSRLRAEASLDLRVAKQRVASFLLLTGTEYTLTKRRWTVTFRDWAAAHELAEPGDTFVFREKVGAVLRLEERLARIEAEMRRVAVSDPDLAALIARLMCIKGVGPVTAFSLAAEVGDFSRFRNGAAFASYVGLVPSERSTGARVSRGRISKLGNSNLRRLLIEAASRYSSPLNPASPRDPSVPDAVAAHAEKCARRLAKRREDLRARGMSANKAKVAVARELAEWIYHIATMPA